MKVSGPAQFYGGPVSFTSAVDFSAANVTGLGVAAASRRLWPSQGPPWPIPVLSASNTGSGPGGFVRGQQRHRRSTPQGLTGIAVAGTQLGLSATSAIGAIFAQGGSYGLIASGGISGGPILRHPAGRQRRLRQCQRAWHHRRPGRTTAALPGPTAMKVSGARPVLGWAGELHQFGRLHRSHRDRTEPFDPRAADADREPDRAGAQRHQHRQRQFGERSSPRAAGRRSMPRASSERHFGHGAPALGTAIYAQTGGGGFKPAVQAVTSRHRPRRRRRQHFAGEIGILGGDPLKRAKPASSASPCRTMAWKVNPATASVSVAWAPLAWRAWSP